MDSQQKVSMALTFLNGMKAKFGVSNKRGVVLASSLVSLALLAGWGYVIANESIGGCPPCECSMMSFDP